MSGKTIQPSRRRRRAAPRARTTPGAARALEPSAFRIAAFLRTDAVIAELRGRTRRAVLAELCAPHARVIAPASAANALFERERLGSTGLGHGLAVPHARIPGLKTTIATFGRSPAGVEFGAPDRKRARFFFALLTPDVRESGETMQGLTYALLLARICSMFERRGFRSALRATRDANAIHRLILREDDAVRRRR